MDAVGGLAFATSGHAMAAARPNSAEMIYFLRSLRFQQAVSLAAFSLVIGIRVV